MKYKLVCFDIDGTLVDELVFVWQTLHDYYGTDKEVRRKMIDRYMNKEITYDEWAKSDVQMFREKGATREGIISALKDAKLMPGAREALQELKEKGIKLAVISGSISLLLDMLFPDHPFDDVLINTLVFDEAGRLIDCVATEFDHEHKATGMKKIAEREGFDLSECVFVGDNHNDVQIAQLAGLSIAFNCKSDTLAEVADVVMPHDVNDVRSILPYILGE
jgi:phosphoserine phosphatase